MKRSLAASSPASLPLHISPSTSLLPLLPTSPSSLPPFLSTPPSPLTPHPRQHFPSFSVHLASQRLSPSSPPSLAYTSPHHLRGGSVLPLLSSPFSLSPSLSPSPPPPSPSPSPYRWCSTHRAIPSRCRKKNKRMRMGARAGPR